VSALDRREFLKVAGSSAGALLVGCARGVAPLASQASALASANIVVVGAGAFGGWTALNLQRMGARVTLVDMYGPGNSRSTSGDETRGVRTSYGDRPHGELWMQWANTAITRWKQWDEEFSKPQKMRLFFTTGDLIMRSEWEPFLTQTRTWWEKNSIAHETLPVDEVRKRWPQIHVDDITAVLYEPNAGVVRARRATESVAEVFRHEGGRILIARVIPPEPGMFDGHTVRLTNGDTLSADTFVFAVGPWLGKTFLLMQNRMRTPLGTVLYFGTPPGDDRFTYPNMPSWNFPGTTGWAALPVDNRGFRVRGGGGGGQRPQAASATSANASTAGSAAPAADRPAASNTRSQASQAGLSDPDLSARWVEPERLTRSVEFVAERFPALKDAPIVQTWACHYESTSSRNFIVDRHPNLRNVWIAGGGNAEAFKMGPVVGEYIARRVLGDEGDPEIARAFRIPETEFTPAANRGD
jgi:glycine/D-amino acid oxidase-like deaminating enzyme